MKSRTCSCLPSINGFNDFYIVNDHFDFSYARILFAPKSPKGDFILQSPFKVPFRGFRGKREGSFASALALAFTSFLENKIDCKDQEDESDNVIETEGFVFKHEQGEDGKDDQGDHLLDHFQLN